MMYVGTAVLFFGIICYVLSPGWYISSLTEVRNTAFNARVQHSEESLLASLRFTSFFHDSYPVSLYSVFIFSISLFNYFRVDERKKYSLICIFVSFVAAILSMHRVSIASSILIFLVFIAYELIKGKTSVVFKILFAGILFVIIASLISETVRERLFSLQEMLMRRTEDMSFSGAYKERQIQSDGLMVQWSFPFFGHGLGSGGITSRFMGYGGVTDAAYTKLLFENGIIGMILFITLLLSSSLRAFKYFRYYVVELSILCFIALAMTGSNTLSLAYLYILPFWYMMGRIWNKPYLRYAKENNIKI